MLGSQGLQAAIRGGVLVGVEFRVGVERVLPQLEEKGEREKKRMREEATVAGIYAI